MTKDIVKHLREWGLKVQTKPGFRYRGRPYSFRPKAVVVHHTASGAQSGNFASEHVVTFGRPGLPGPLCHFLLGRDGTVKIISLGYANHAGAGGPKAGIPRNLGNTYAWGIEAENNGVGEKWTKQQLNAYYRLCAALLDYMGYKRVWRVIGHKEWTSRKIDPAGINMGGFRRQVKRALKHGPSVKTVSVSKVRRGKRNKDVRAVKYRLIQRGFYKGRLTRYFNKGMERAYLRYERSLGWKGDGKPDKLGLRKLGFRVVP